MKEKEVVAASNHPEDECDEDAADRGCVQEVPRIVEHVSEAWSRQFRGLSDGVTFVESRVFMGRMKTY